MYKILHILFLGLLITLWSNPTLAQDEKKARRKIMFSGETHHFFILNGKTKCKVSDDITYAWFKNNSIHKTQGGYSGQLLDDTYIIYNLNNDLKEKGSYRKGRKDGAWKTWYNNGRLKEIYTWKKGVLNGKYCFYDSIGQISMTGNYNNNEKHGRFINYYEGAITYRQYYKNGVSVFKQPKKKKVEVEKVECLEPIKAERDSVVVDTNRVKKSGFFSRMFSRKGTVKLAPVEDVVTPDNKDLESVQSIGGEAQPIPKKEKLRLFGGRKKDEKSKIQVEGSSTPLSN